MTKSIKEVADIMGCSVQAVYNRLEKDFKPYLKIENGKKRLDEKILKYINKENYSSEFSNELKQVLNILEKQNEQLQKELEVKNSQISEMQRLLDQQQQLQLQQQNQISFAKEKTSLINKLFNKKKAQ